MSSKAAAASTDPLVPTESPVPGVNMTLASLLVEVIKTKRKFISKSSQSSQPNDDEKESLLQNIENKATDATTAFLNELRNQAESSASRRDKNSANAPTNCLKFLLEIVSNDSNSFHLRRAALALIREILQRSSDARACVASGETLLDFVSIVERIQDTGEECDATILSSSSSRVNETILSPAALFHQEAIELIHQLALQYGQLYPKFTVASRLLGDMSIHLQLQSQNIGAITGEGGRNNNQRHNIQLIRKKRDEALERGQKACQSLERMVERADDCFKVLLPRWGGFNVDDEMNDDKKSSAKSTPDNPISDDASVDLDDDDSIEWEDGDTDLLSDDEEEGKVLASDHDHDTSSHVGAVAQTLAVMERSGTLLDGKLSVEVGKVAPNSSTPTELESEGSNEDATKARLELEAIIKKLSSKRIQRLRQWIHALTYADGMMERAVVDPTASAASGNVGTAGPVSVVLLSKDKRTLRGPLLQQMMKLKGEVEGVLKSAEVLGVRSESGEAREREDSVQAAATATEATLSNNAGAAKRKRPWLTGVFTQGHQTTKKQKQTKNAKVRVIYRRK
eukprot:scaffold3126_cov138-Skeletonema_dohrnii-CCMP3373.AAC.3